MIFFAAIYQKAEALYHLGDFEHSLVFYHRGLHVRPELEQFRLGVQKAREAIENAIGKCVPKSSLTPLYINEFSFIRLDSYMNQRIVRKKTKYEYKNVKNIRLK